VRPFFIRSLPMHSFGRRPRRVGRARSSGTREEASSSNYMVLLPTGGSRPRSLGRGPGSSMARSSLLKLLSPLSPSSATTCRGGVPALAGLGTGPLVMGKGIDVERLIQAVVVGMSLARRRR